MKKLEVVGYASNASEDGEKEACQWIESLDREKVEHTSGFVSGLA